jgi:hypothetical protein
VAHFPGGAFKDKEQFRGGLSSFRITAIYLVTGALWILLSDWLLAALTRDPLLLARLGIIKGWCYVLATAGLLYVLIRRHETALLHASEVLEQRVEERTRELSTLLLVSHSVASTLELEPLLNLILEQLQDVVDYTGASVLIKEGEGLAIRAHRGPIPLKEALRMRFPMEPTLSREVILAQKPVVIADVLNDTPLARDLRAMLSDYAPARPGTPLGGLFDFIRSWMGVPLIVKGKASGLLTLS